MPKYIIEREIPGLGGWSAEQQAEAARKSNKILKDLGAEIQWLHSYVTSDKLYCVYIAPNEALVREHAQRGKFPANRVSEVKGIMDPSTGGA